MIHKYVKVKFKTRRDYALYFLKDDFQEGSENDIYFNKGMMINE